MVRKEDRQRIDEQLRMCELARELTPGRDPPYFGHMRLATAQGITDVLVGAEVRSDPRASVIDWRSSSLAEVFFGTDEGEHYEISQDGRALEGELLERNVVRFEAGELVEVGTAAHRLIRTATREWIARPAGPSPRLWHRPDTEQGARGPRIDFKLDAAQQRVVDLPAARAALILGEAGCGKTTVALHRLAHLCKSRHLRSAVIVPTDGLRRLTELLLRRLGVPGVEVWLYDRWAALQARRAFPDLPRRESADASAAVLRLKRHWAIRHALDEIAARPAALPEEEEETIRSDAWARRHDLQHLFGDKAVLARASAAEGDAFTASAIAETFEHTRVQFTLTAEEEFAHVDAARLATLDGRTLDDGTPAQDAGSVDVEDYAVFFELDRLRAKAHRGKPTAPLGYDCIVVDEAQELAPLELKLVGRCLSKGGTLIVAGDADQQIDPAVSFLGWPATMAALGAEQFESATLEVSYRCPPEVTALARGVLDPSRRPQKTPASAALALARFDHEFHLAAWLVEALREIQEHDRAASVAIICRSPETARKLFPVVRHGVIARLALDGNFAFTAGTSLASVRDVKGLEFEIVIIPDASPETYPEVPESQRALYVAATRASRQLVLATIGQLSPLLPSES